MSLVKSGLVIASLTFISRIFGLLRELVMAQLFGTNLYADVVNTAFKFPNLFRRIFGEGALSSVFVPIYSQKLLKSDQNAEKFASEIFSLLLVALIGITLLIQLFMPQIMMVIAPGFLNDATKFELSIFLCRITIPYLIFICMSALLGGMMNSNKNFASFAFIPVLLNIAIIIASLPSGDDKSKAIYVSIGIILGGIMQLLFMIYACKLAGIKYHFRTIKNLSNDSALFLKNMVPATIASSVTQINLFVSQAIASFAPGAISILSYADRIYQFPLSIIGICFGTVLLPNLSVLYKSGDEVGALKLQTKAIKLSLALSIAAACGIIAIANPMMHIIYERGAFTADDTIKTAATISIFAVGLPSFILNKVLTPIFYAKLDTKTPLKITVTTILCNLTINMVLIEEYKHLGIAFGTTIASWFNILLLYVACKIRKIPIVTENIYLFLIKSLICGGVMYLSLKVFCLYAHSFLFSSSSAIKFLMLIFLVFIGVIIFAITSIALKIVSRTEIKNLLKR